MSLYQESLDPLQPLRPIPTSVSPRIHPFPDCKAMLFDIYGTLLISASGDIGHQDMRAEAMEKALCRMTTLTAPLDPQRALVRYRQHIEQAHDRMKQQGVIYPEIDILEIWRELLTELDAGSEPLSLCQHELRRVALDFECNINPVWPMPHFRETLQRLFESDLYLGMISNAQFYTPILVNFFLGHLEEEGDQIKGFEPNLVYFSWKLARAKPDTWAFAQALKSLAKLNIQPSEVMFIGNDLLKDIYPAHQVGMKTCLFAGDQRSLRLREDDLRVQGIKPDFVVDDLKQLLDIVR